MSERLRKEILAELDDAWLNINRNVPLAKPLDLLLTEDADEYYQRFVWLLTQPEYISFLCKSILNIDILPFQSLILQEMWKRKFPMFIATRGGGKCTSGNTKICTKYNNTTKIQNIYDLIGDVTPNTKINLEGYQILNEKGEWNNIEYGWNNGYSETIKIETKFGYSLEGTLDHPIRCVRNNNLEWIHLKDIKIGDYIPIDRNSSYFDNHQNGICPKLGYLFGVLVGDGGYTVRGKITITSMDDIIIKHCNLASKKYWNKVFRKTATKGKASDYTLCSVKIWDQLFQQYGFNFAECEKKDFPSCILSSNKKTIAAFIKGLMDTDGCLSSNKIEFCSKSSSLTKNLQFILTRFGIISKVKCRYNKKYNQHYYHLYIRGNNIDIYMKQIGFGLDRKRNKYLKKDRNTNSDIIPNSLIKCLESNKKNYTYKSLPDELKNEYTDQKYFYDPIVKIEKGFNQTFDIHCKDDHSFISNGIISHNSWLLSVYSMIRTILIPQRKVVIAGAAFRQSKILFDYMEKIWDGAPILRDMRGDRKDGPKAGVDQCNFWFNGGYARCLPVGSGDKIRGQRANDIIADEFQSQVIEIFENVIAGFGAVSASPVENVKHQAKLNRIKILMERHGEDYIKNIMGGFQLEEDNGIIPNQVIISGTAYYDFNHFAKYWKRWKKIITSKGDKSVLKEVFGGEPVPDGFDWKDYSVIRIPIGLIPKGFMEDAQIARAKATVHSGIYLMEYEACHSVDSKGFFKRSLIESCVTSDNNPVVTRNGEQNFEPLLKGNPKKQYVMGVDPASEQDNFSIIMIELNEDHNRVVYCWSINRKKHVQWVQEGLVKENNYYAYCAEKIRELTRKFNTVRISMDSQGGGVTISEFLHDPNYMKPNEKPIWPIIEENKEKDTDHNSGDHILELCNFAKYEWLREANHGLRKCFEDKELLFPRFDPILIGISINDDMINNRKLDTLEDCMMEIEELKNELCIIEVTTTVNGRDRWDVPEIKIGVGKKERMHKDRYSALLMANAGAKSFNIKPIELVFEYGGVAQSFGNTKGVEYIGPSWFTEGIKGVYD